MAGGRCGASPSSGSCPWTGLPDLVAVMPPADVEPRLASGQELGPARRLGRRVRVVARGSAVWQSCLRSLRRSWIGGMGSWTMKNETGIRAMSGAL